jgi:hypothetical protein
VSAPHDSTAERAERMARLAARICAEHPDIAEMMKDVDVSLMRLQLALDPLDRWRNATSILRWRGAAANASASRQTRRAPPAVDGGEP